MNAVDVHDLRFRYDDGTEAIRGIRFAVEDGECVGLVGPNGAGKSTLLQHLNGILPEELDGSGAVRIFGEAVAAANISKIRKMVGHLFQDPDDQIFCPTVFEDVAFGPRQFGLPEIELAARVQAALARVGLEGFDHRHPYHLSRGEKRRVCLAGVLACDPRILVLDEPTSDLDPRARRELKAFLRNIHTTRIIATHDLELVVELCPRVIVLDRGNVVADGPTLALLADEELMLAHGLEKPHALRHTHPH